MANEAQPVEVMNPAPPPVVKIAGVNVDAMKNAALFFLIGLVVGVYLCKFRKL